MGRPEPDADLDRLVQEHLPSTIRFAIRLTGNVEAAEELVQEALLRVSRGWTGFRGEARFRTWLFRIVINAFHDRRTEPRRIDQLPPDLADVRGANPADGILYDELNRLMAARVSALPPRQREVLILMTYEQMTPRQVSELLEISEANVYATLHLARQRLRQELAPYLVEK